MKTIILFLFPIILLAQTGFTDANIRAARQGDEWLLTNTNYHMVNAAIQDFTFKKTNVVAAYEDCGKGCDKFFVDIQPFKDSKKSSFNYTIYTTPDNSNKMDWIVNKVVIKGDYNRLVEFFTQFWSGTINFDDITPGEIASTHFLTDIAIFSFDAQNNPQIIVETKADRVN